jgi:predicted acyl esterase
LADGFEQEHIVANFAHSELRYQTAPLEADAVLVGVPSVRLFVDGTAATKYQVNVHLTDDAPNAPPRLISWGTWIVERASNAEGAEIAMDLSYTGRRIKAGHRLGLTITNLDLQVLVPGEEPLLRHLPYFERSTTAVHRTATKASSVEVPVIAGEQALPLP